MAKSPAFQWYPRDILSSARVQQMSLTEEAAYRRLIDYCWLNGSVPADPEMAARLIGKGATRQVAKVALQMFSPNPVDPATVIHDRLEQERAKQADNSKKRREAAKSRWRDRRTAEARGKKLGKSTNGSGKQATPPAAVAVDANALQVHMQKQCISSSSSFSTAPSENKLVPSSTHTQDASRVCDEEPFETRSGTRSRFDFATCLRWAQRAGGIRNPGGFATTIHRSGEQDAVIAAWLEGERDQPAQALGKMPGHEDPELLERVLAKARAEVVSARIGWFEGLRLSREGETVYLTGPHLRQLATTYHELLAEWMEELGLQVRVEFV